MRLGKRHFEIAMKWIPSAATFGAGATLGLLYITDWRVVVDYIPYYNGKFQDN